MIALKYFNNKFNKMDDSLDNVLSDDRIMNSDEIADIKDLILCGICYQVVTQERKPVECSSCQN